jgi:PleD family two-component response regulator
MMTPAIGDDGVTSPRALLERADGAMYQAKVGGKNRVALCGAH